MNAPERPKTESVLAGLKPFQRDTVEHAFYRLYHAPDTTGRFLVADEVGLGKTLVARGIVAKAIDYLWDRVGRIDIIYICSNAELANQNINRLNVTGKDDFSHASRITLLPLHLDSLHDKLNFVSFTPGTSFDLKSSMGISDERALLYLLLREPWELSGRAPRKVFQGWVGTTVRFESTIGRLEEKYGETIAQSPIAGTFVERLQDPGAKDLQRRFDALATRFVHIKHIPEELAIERAEVVGRLREILAEVCLEALEPDLVILDEFQRFRDLLTTDSMAGELAHKLFTYSDQHSEVKTLLLSATPYKMYTTYLEDENHYEDFVRTASFLNRDAERTDGLKQLINDYRSSLYEVGRHGGSAASKVSEAAARLQSELSRIIARTERNSTESFRDNMSSEHDHSDALVLDRSEIEDYLRLAAIVRDLNTGGLVEYWKSAPYLVSFMDQHYELKKTIREVEDVHGLPRSLHPERAGKTLISTSAVRRYGEIPLRNARLRHFASRLEGSWRHLWIPPSIPYYRLERPFDREEYGGTKRLIFSNWTVVPKVISGLTSYLAERDIFTTNDPTMENSTEARETMSGLLRFSVSQRGNEGMPVLGLIYPSVALARVSLRDEQFDSVPNLDALLDRIARNLQPQTGELSSRFGDPGADVDRNWYWAAPILMDHQDPDLRTLDWLESSFMKIGVPEASTGSADTNWVSHVRHAIEILGGNERLGSVPEDLPRVLARMAVGGFGTVALRGLARIRKHANGIGTESVRYEAGRIGWALRNFFNRPEATAVVHISYEGEPFWQRVLDYTVAGCLQAVLDEYFHILDESLGTAYLEQDGAIPRIVDACVSALSLRASRLEYDEFTSVGGNAERRTATIRTRYALRYGEQTSDTDGSTTFGSQIRSAFNSPFWPFVLATTSVGQEGLDFHAYCHAVLHWNAPYNPVDIEQRDGRIHRYKGHAVRRNAAHRFGERALAEDDNPWRRLFSLASPTPDPSRGLVPFWLCEGPYRIERHVYALPFSRGSARYARLRRALTVYRMVFGQPHQQDLVSFLLGQIQDIETVASTCAIDLRPPVFGE